MISDDLRKAIADSGLSLREIERQTGVSNANLSRFMQGESLGGQSMEKVAEVLGLSLQPKRARGKRK